MIIRSHLRTLGIAALFALALVLGACAAPVDPDPYADPGTSPPPTITNPTITTSGSVAPRAGSDLIDINVAGFAAPSGGDTVPALTRGDFTVVENGVVKGITVERIGGTVRAEADIAFVFDTTASMGSALASVQTSIIEFVDFLDERGLDVRVGAVTFGDAFDTKTSGSTRTGESISGWTPPGFDPSERPSIDLTDDFDAFRTFIGEDSPRGGGDVPENALGALEFAYDSLSWRPGAQKILIVIIDTCSHNDVTFEQFGEAGEPWKPSDPDALLARMRGNAIVHSVSPPNVIENDFFCSDAHTDMAMFTGASGTGGVFVPVAFGAFDFDLTELPIAEAAAGGYIVTYRGNRSGTTHTIRVVIDDGGEIRGEFTTTGTY